MLLMIIFFLTYVTLPRPLQSRPVPSRPFEWKPVESKRDAKFWVRLLNKRSREIFVSSAEQDLLILAFSLCLLHRGHNLDPDDSEVLFHLALNHALMRQVRINSKIIDCSVLWNGWFEQWGVSKEAWSMKLVRKNYRKKIVLSTQLSLYGWCSPINVLLQCYFPHFNLFSGLYFEYLLVRYNICLCSYYFEFSAATDNVFLLFLVAVLIPVIFMLWCGIIKRFQVWIVSNSSLKVCFTFISRWQRPWRTSEMHLKWTWINPFFCIF